MLPEWFRVFVYRFFLQDVSGGGGFLWAILWVSNVVFSLYFLTYLDSVSGTFNMNIILFIRTNLCMRPGVSVYICPSLIVCPSLIACTLCWWQGLLMKPGFLLSWTMNVVLYEITAWHWGSFNMVYFLTKVLFHVSSHHGPNWTQLYLTVKVFGSVCITAQAYTTRRGCYTHVAGLRCFWMMIYLGILFLYMMRRRKTIGGSLLWNYCCDWMHSLNIYSAY